MLHGAVTQLQKMNQRIIALIAATLAFTPIQTIAAAAGRAAPNCALTPLGDKQRYDMRQFHGKVLYVDFWASWCGPCAQSFPFLNDLDREFRDQGLQVLGINLDEIPSEAQNFLVRHPANFTVAADVDAQQCAQDFGVKAMPSSYLIDRNGIIRHEHLGFRPGESEQLRILVKQLLAEGQAGH